MIRVGAQNPGHPWWDVAEVVVYDDGVHCCYYWHLELRPSISDWPARQLEEETTWQLTR